MGSYATIKIIERGNGQHVSDSPSLSEPTTFIGKTGLMLLSVWDFKNDFFKYD